MNEIEKVNANELATVERGMQKISDNIDRMSDSDDARKCMSDMKMLEAMLEQADKLGEFACKFACLEAKMLVTIAKLGIEPPSRKELIAWLASKSDEETNEILYECSTGIRVGRIKARETRAENKARSDESQIREFKRIGDELIGELESTGRTKIGVMEYVSRWSLPEAPDKEMVRGCVERTRDRALAMDASSTGVGDNDYLMPRVASQDEMRLIIANKLKLVHYDLLSMKKLLDGSNLVLAPKDTAQIREDIDMLER